MSRLGKTADEIYRFLQRSAELAGTSPAAEWPPRWMSSQLQREFGLAEQCRGHEHLTRSTEQYPATSAVVRCRPRGALAFAAIMPSASRTGRYPGEGKGLTGLLVNSLQHYGITIESIVNIITIDQ